MKKGLTQTLMTVAIALISVQAMAMAPVISDIPSPVVGGINQATDTHQFVYPDAIDLNTMASDDYTAKDKLMWSYTGSNLSYVINGVAPLDLAKNDPTSPSLSQVINMTLASTETKDVDKKANTITIRNKRLAPLGGSVTFPSGSGVVTADTQLVTFFCSDGNSYSSSTVFFYTDNGGMDRLSKAAPKWTPVKADPISTLSSWPLDGGAMGTVNAKQLNGSGVCLDVGTTPTGNNMGAVKTAYGYFSLAANQVYQIRAKMNSSQTATGTVPFWDMMLDNYDGTSGYNLYGFDAFNLDNEGDANAIFSSGAGTEFKIVWAPAAVATPQWNDATNGMFTSAKQAGKDGRFRFRVMDVDVVAATKSDIKFGSICLQSLTIESTPYANLKQVGSAVYDQSSFAKGGTTGGNVSASALLASTISFTGGAITITPSTAGKTAELVTIAPDTDGAEPTFGTWATYMDNYPIHWDSDTIYKLEVTMAAPDTNSATNGFDAMWLGFDSPTNEMNAETVLTNAQGGFAMPKTTAAPYVFFYYSGKETKSGVTQWHQLRYRVRFANADTLLWGDNSGGVKITAIKVTKVAVQ